MKAMSPTSGFVPKSIDPSRLSLNTEDSSSGTLVGMKCGDCEVYVFGPALYCQSCTSEDLEPVELGTTGTLYSYTQVHVSPEGWPGEVPYILGQIELPQGPHLLAEIVDSPAGDLTIGMKLYLTLRPVQIDGGEEYVMVYKFSCHNKGKRCD